MAEQPSEVVLAALKTRLDAIVADGGVTYWYKPKVARVDTWLDTEQDLLVKDFLAAPFTALMYLRPGRSSNTEEASYTIDGELEIFVLAGARHAPASETNPFEQVAPIGQTIQNRLYADIEKAITSDVTLGLSGAVAVVNTHITDVNRSLHTDEWGLLEIRIVCEFTYVVRP